MSKKDRLRALLWCDRHCCLCKKACGIDIEIHHIIPTGKGGADTLENLIPLCFECHSRVQHYNEKHALGTKYSPDELSEWREQRYEEFTRHLVPPVSYDVTQVHGGIRRSFPDIGFTLSHGGNSLPVHVRIALSAKLGKRTLRCKFGPYYDGTKPWRMNPGSNVLGHFRLPTKAQQNKSRLEVEVRASIIDCIDRKHELLPFGFVYDRKAADWYAEP